MKKLLSLLIAVLIVLLLPSISSADRISTDIVANNAGTSISDAPVIEINSYNYYYGTIIETQLAYYYKFSLPSSGRIMIDANFGTIEEVTIQLFDQKGNRLISRDSAYNQTLGTHAINWEYDLLAGEYYLCFRRHSDSASFLGTYYFRIEFEPSNESFAESQTSNNNSISTASIIPLNTRLIGQLAYNDEYDYYKFTLPTSGRITLAFDFGTITDIPIKLFDQQNNHLWTINSEYNQTSGLHKGEWYYDLVAGDYCISLQRESLINAEKYCGNYVFYVYYVSSNESTVETQSSTNNDFNTASTIALNTTQYGQIGFNDSIDYYRFSLERPTTLTIEADFGSMKNVNCRLYDENGNQKFLNTVALNTLTGKTEWSKDISLSAGVYYFCIYRYTTGATESCAYTGPYSFILITERSLDAYLQYNDGEVSYKGNTPYTLYNGSAQKPAITVYNADTDEVISPSYYTIQYENNTNPGTAYVNVTFKNGYYGSCRAMFKIYLRGTTDTMVENRDNGIYIEWEPVETAGGYVIYRRAWNLTSSGWTTFERWNHTTDTAWTDTKVYAGTRYQYGIKAYYNDPMDNYNLGIVGPLKTTVRITTRKLNSVTPGKKQLTIKWAGSSLFTGYEVQIATDAAFTKNVKTVKITNPKTYQTTIKSLKAKTTYYVRVRSYHVFEGMTYFGGWSNVLNAKTK